jgi:RNA polymerase sigma-70 factor (ECF subfamily)
VIRAERTALGELYTRHGAKMLALTRHILGNPRDAEDVLHEVFLEVWQRAGDYDPARGSVLAWLLVRVRSRALDRVRSHQRARLSAGESGPIEPAEVFAAQDAFIVRDAVARLPDRHRVLLELCYYAGMTSSEIAEHVRLPIGTVKSRVARALAVLRETFGTLPALDRATRDDEPDSCAP